MRQEIDKIHDHNEEDIRNPLEQLPKEFDLNDYLKDFGKLDCG